MSFNDCFSKTFVSRIQKLHLIVLAKTMGWVVPHGKVYSLVAARLRAGAQPSESWLAPSPPKNNVFMFLESRQDGENPFISLTLFLLEYKTDSLLVCRSQTLMLHALCCVRACETPKYTLLRSIKVQR